MRRILIVVPLLCLIGAAAYLLVSKEIAKSIPAFEALPATPMLVIQAEEAPALLEELAQNSAFKSLKGTGVLAKLQAGLSAEESLFSDTTMALQLQNTETIAAAYMTRAGQFDYLFVRSLDELSEKRAGKIDGMHWEGSSLQTAIFEKKEIKQLAIPTDGKSTDGESKSWNFCITNGLLVQSFDRGLIEDAILHLKKGTPLTSKNNFEELTTAGLDEGLLRLYVNYAGLSEFISVFAASDFAPKLEGLAAFGEWSALDFKIGESSIFITGLSTSSEVQPKRTSALAEASLLNGKKALADSHKDTDPSQKLLGRFSSLDTLGRQIEHVLPGSTALLFRLAGGELDRVLPQRPEWLGAEWAFGLTESLDGDWLGKSFVCARVSSTEAAAKSLAAESTEQLKERGSQYFKLNAALGKQIGTGIYGKSDGEIWAVLAGEHLLLASEKQFLKHLIAKKREGQTLANEPAYLHYRESLLENSNVFLYVDMAGVEPVLNKLVAEKYRESFSKAFAAFNGIQPMAVQLDKHREVFLTTGYIWQNAGVQGGDLELWRSPLERPLSSMRPVLVKNHATKETEVMVQDESHKLYLFSKGGEQLWSKQLDGPVLGEISQVDYYKNRKLQYLLSTAGNIYMVDRMGRNVADFPIKLTAKATNGVFVVDYEGKRDYRMFIGSSNGNLYGYYKTGKPLPGWSPKRKAGKLNDPVMHFASKGKDYLVGCNEEATVYLWDRKGDKRVAPISLKSKLLGQLKLDRSSSPVLIGCDTIGNVYRIGLNGKYTKVQLPRVDGTTDFRAADVSGDAKLELLVLTGQQLDVFDYKGRRKFTYKLPDREGNALQLVKLPNHKKQTIALLSPSSGEWLALDEEGNTLQGFPVEANGVFTAGALVGSDAMLVGGSGNNLIVRRWPK